MIEVFLQMAQWRMVGEVYRGMVRPGKRLTDGVEGATLPVSSYHGGYSMDHRAIELRVREIIAAELNVPVDQVKPETDIARELDADSLDVINMVMTLEEAFSLNIPDEDAEKFVRVSDIVSYIEVRRGGEGPASREAPAA